MCSVPMIGRDAPLMPVPAAATGAVAKARDTYSIAG